MNSIGLAFNIYNDNNALHGLLELASHYFDDIVAVHAGPMGRHSTDGTIETLEKWKIRTVFTSIDEGFGTVRTRCIRESQASFVCIMDSDERFYPIAPILRCHGTEAYPAIANPKLSVSQEGTYNQGDVLKQLIQEPHIRAIKTVRRHWFKPGFSMPCQNWHNIPDVQLRIVKNDKGISYNPLIRMHEQIVCEQTGGEPRHAMFNPSDVRGLFMDHYHCFWKSMEPDQRKEDIAIYDAIHFGTQEETWKKLGYKKTDPAYDPIRAVL